jgi:hypothetical protein
LKHFENDEDVVLAQFDVPIHREAISLYLNQDVEPDTPMLLEFSHFVAQACLNLSERG